MVFDELCMFNQRGLLVDLVVCDGAPDVTGLHYLDTYNQSHLLLAAVNITTHLLLKSGAFVAKIFVDSDVSILVDQMRLLFDQVELHKPVSSRTGSTGNFIKGYVMLKSHSLSAWDITRVKHLFQV